jgi:single-stranded-DNA-specific exonuclease
MLKILVPQPAPQDEVAALARGCGLSKVLAEVLWNRGFRDPHPTRTWLDADPSGLEDPWKFYGMMEAVERVRKALYDREKILIHGDYDVDGLTGTVLLHSFFKLCGSDPSIHIPSREEGYSFSETSLKRIQEGGFSLCVSVDNGTAEIEAIAKAQASGCDVIVTDHHATGPEIAPAHTVLNPRLAHSTYPFPDLAGVGVAFKLAWAVAQSFSKRKILSEDFQRFMVEASALVSLGTVADVVPLHGENRILVRQGLKALLHSSHPGLRALIDVLGPRYGLEAEDVSFRLGPRINAAGRMGQADLAIRLLTARSYGEARTLAKKIESLNRQRQQIERRTVQEALEKLKQDPLLDSRRVILVWDPSWHLGILGIIAARLSESFHRPAIVLSPKEGRARGSGRSFGETNLKILLDSAKNLMSRYGGHAKAVGLEVEEKKLEALRERLEEEAAKLPPFASPSIKADVTVGLDHWNRTELSMLDRFRPFGAGNPVPKFHASNVRIGRQMKRIGPDGRGIALTAIQNGCSIKGLAYKLGTRIGEFLDQPGGWNLVYTPRVPMRVEEGCIELFVHALERQVESLGEIQASHLTHEKPVETKPKETL